MSGCEVMSTSPERSTRRKRTNTTGAVEQKRVREHPAPQSSIINIITNHNTGNSFLGTNVAFYPSSSPSPPISPTLSPPASPPPSQRESTPQQPNPNVSLTAILSQQHQLEQQQQAQFVGMYRIGQTLGTGSFGKVKLGKNMWTGDQVAIKSVPMGRRDYRLDREIEILKLLDHPNIVRLYDIIEANNKIHLIMEYVSGGELFDYIVQKRRLREEEARRYFREMISALEYCHGNLVAHRDLKLENILLTDDGHIKIADFGFSTAIRPGALLHSFCGSPMYSAPELFLGKDYLGPPVDIWALGTILFAMVCGYLPFGRWKDDMRTLVRKVCSAEFEIPNWVSKPCQKLINLMMQPNVSNRICIEEIRKDPWVNQDCSHPPPCLLPRRPALKESKLNPQILHQLSSLGYGSVGAIKEKLLATEERSQIVAIYYLLQEQQQLVDISLEVPELDEADLSPSPPSSPQSVSTSTASLVAVSLTASAPIPVPSKLQTIVEEEDESPSQRQRPEIPRAPQSPVASPPGSHLGSPVASPVASPLASPTTSPSPSPPRTRLSSNNSKKESASTPSSPSSFGFRWRPRRGSQIHAREKVERPPPDPQPHTSREFSRGDSSSGPISYKPSAKINTPTKLHSSDLVGSSTGPPAMPSTSSSGSSTPTRRRFSFGRNSGVKVVSKVTGDGGNSGSLRSYTASMFNVDTSSSKSPEEIAQLIQSALESQKPLLRYKVSSNGFEFKCTVARGSKIVTSPTATSEVIEEETAAGEAPISSASFGSASPSPATFEKVKGNRNGEGSFVIQVCMINKLGLYGVRCTHFSGDRWFMRDICREILTSLNL